MLSNGRVELLINSVSFSVTFNQHQYTIQPGNPAVWLLDDHERG
jgi:hypothetical protein